MGIKSVYIFPILWFMWGHNQDRNQSLVQEGQVRQGDQISAVDSHSISRYVPTHPDCLHHVKW